jgi:acetyl-CoA carboxylase carboxyltransferase component
VSADACSAVGAAVFPDDALRLAGELVVDDVVQPGDLRAQLIRRLAAAGGKDRSFSRRRHGVIPAQTPG